MSPGGDYGCPSNSIGIKLQLQWELKTILATQSDEGANRLRDAQIAFITDRHEPLISR